MQTPRIRRKVDEIQTTIFTEIFAEEFSGLILLNQMAWHPIHDDLNCWYPNEIHTHHKHLPPTATHITEIQ